MHRAVAVFAQDAQQAISEVGERAHNRQIGARSEAADDAACRKHIHVLGLLAMWRSKDVADHYAPHQSHRGRVAFVRTVMLVSVDFTKIHSAPPQTAAMLWMMSRFSESWWSIQMVVHGALDQFGEGV
jgi:hypothetical protein